MSSLFIKRGDVMDIGGVVEIREAKVDTTASYNFSTWSISCQIRTGPTLLDTLVATVAVTFVGATPVFTGEVSALVTAGFPDQCYMDLRFKDAAGKTRSSQTVSLIAQDSVSVAP